MENRKHALVLTGELLPGIDAARAWSEVAKFFRIDDARREVRFTELLKESRSGMSSGGDDDFGPSGFGVQRTSYNSRTDTVQDSIEEQAARYRSKYPLDFRYDAVSPQVRGIAETAGYTLAYGVLN